jgi:hypothetical protein
VACLVIVILLGAGAATLWANFGPPRNPYGGFPNGGFNQPLQPPLAAPAPSPPLPALPASLNLPRVRIEISADAPCMILRLPED